MIDFESLKQDKELERASENLPEKSYVTAYVVPEVDNLVDYDFFLFGRNEEGLDKNAISYFNMEQEWITRTDSSFDKSDDNFCICFESIPKNIQYIDLFLLQYVTRTAFDECLIEFQTEQKEKIFSYFIKSKKSFPHIFCGTFARVTNGWKFYPNFHEHELELEDILGKYDKHQ